MNLVIDFGNTRIKAGLFDNHHLVENKVYGSQHELCADTGFLKKADKVIIGSVVNSDKEVLNAISADAAVSYFTSKSKIPIENRYESASTLGSDRLAASIGAYQLYPNQNVLVIDAGTCIKFNFTNKNNHYLGGAISPGIQMRFKSLQQFTDKLPLVNFNPDFEKLIGTTTEESLLSGVINGVLQEVDGIINEYKLLYPDLTIVVCGGDTEFFAKRLKNRIFAHPHLVLSGLNEILIYNS